MLRTFIALKLDAAARDGIVRLQAALATRFGPGNALRPTRPDQLHVTIAFLGDTDPAAVPQITSLIQRVARHHAPFTLPVQGLLCLPKPARVQVVALGFADQAGLADALAGETVSQLSSQGWRLESRRFLPHITLFRSRKPFRCPIELLVEPLPVSGELLLELSEIGHYASHLQPDGARYEVLSSTLLGTHTK